MQKMLFSDTDFSARVDALINNRRENNIDVKLEVQAIIEDVKLRGDRALAEYSADFDNHILDSSEKWFISGTSCRQAYHNLDTELKEALNLAADRIRNYHKDQIPQNRDFIDSDGVRQGAIWRPVEAAGLYVPGGLASYPSSLLMNAIPAKVAGVKRLAVATPTPNGVVNPSLLAAAYVAGIDEIWRVGGAQAIAALAYGTSKIPKVDVITGPGNAWVAEAKRQLYGIVGIDMIAGPSEILVIADKNNPVEWIAADLLSQAEHDPLAQSILITDDENFADAVALEVETQLNDLSTWKTAAESWKNHGAVIVTENLSQAIPIANLLAAEHVELAVANPDELFSQINHAGSVFLGRMTPEAIGDYVAGPNHVLPTGRRARFASGLSVLDFMKRTSFVALDHSSLKKIGPAASVLANSEGLPAHAKSVDLRLK